MGSMTSTTNPRHIGLVRVPITDGEGADEEDALLESAEGDTSGRDTHAHDALFKKVSWYLLPLFFAMVVLCYVDRTNLAFAAIQLNEDLDFGPEVFGLGSGLFFLGYASLQIPSNLMLRHVSANYWLAGIIFAWGITATSMGWMKTAAQFYALRLLLGATESGAFPGMWYFLTRFYPQDRLTMPYAVVESGISLSHVIAGPIAAMCLSFDGVLGLQGWQWLFILEGIPTLALAVAMLRFLPNSIKDARFLTDKEKHFLSYKVNSARGTTTSTASLTTWELLRGAFNNPFVWYMGASKFVRDVAGFGIIFWTPTIVNAIIKGTSIHLETTGPGSVNIKQHSHHKESDGGIQAALLTSIPFALAAGISFVIAHHSQKHNEKVLHIALPFFFGGLVFSLFPWAVSYSATAGFACLTVGIIGVYSGGATSLALLADVASGPSYVVAAPLYNSVGNVGGFFGPVMVGYLVHRFNSFALPSVMMGMCLSLAGLMIGLMPRVLKMQTPKAQDK